MGWKSTVDISRDKAIGLIMSRILVASNTELSNALDSFGFGDNPELPYHCCNFSVLDKLPENSSPDGEEG